MPPPGSEAVVRSVEIAFPTQGGVSVVDPQTYLYYVRTRPSRPSADTWEPYDPALPLEDFRRLWATGFLDNLWVTVRDEPYGNGVVGMRIVFNLEERVRVRFVDYDGSKALDRGKIEDQLRTAGLQIRPDTFLDQGLIHRVETAVRGMLREKGFPFAAVTHEVQPVPDNQRLAHLVFHLDQGPTVRIETVSFSGNHQVGSRVLRNQLESNRPRPWWRPSFLGGSRGGYFEDKLEDDADRILAAYRNRGYVSARVGVPELVTLREDPKDRIRRVDLRFPVTEGPRYRVRKVSFEGAGAIKEEALRTLFSLRPGRYYNEEVVRKGLEKAREVYGSIGYYEFTGYPDVRPLEAPDTRGPDGGSKGPSVPETDRPAEVDVVIRLQEGRQYFVHRIAFTGNTTTRDHVIRRELALVEGGVFSTEALKYSIKRLNQLGYFKPIEDQKAIQVDKVPDAADRVDLTIKVEEQNRNQLQFGAGISQYDGLFANVWYTVANFMGRGETVTVALQKGMRSNLYQVGFTEPYLFERPISLSAELYSRKNDYYGTTGSVLYSEVREGITGGVGRPLFWPFFRAFLGYTYEVTDVAISGDLSATLKSSAASSGLLGIPSFSLYLDSGRHVDSRFQPTFIYDTVDHPLVPHRGLRVTASGQVAGTWLRGAYNYVKPDTEAIWYLPTTRRTGFGFRAQAGWLHMYGTTREIPYYLRYFLGGEYQIRGVNIRTVGPRDDNGLALGGNKYVLFNAEYYVDVMGPVRAVVFHDAGQAFAEAVRVDLRQLRTSTGAELRVVMPMLNVPFRLIWARNFYRDTDQPEWAVKFAVGTTF